MMQPVTRYVLCFLLTALVILNSQNLTEYASSLFSKKYADKQDYATALYYQSVTQNCLGNYFSKDHLNIVLAALYNDIDPWTFQKIAKHKNLSQYSIDCVLKEISPET